MYTESITMSAFGHHHAYRRDIHRHKKKSSIYLITIIDKFVYIIGLFAVMANLPQLLNIWVEKNTNGVSLVSWGGFLIGSLFWFWYGLLHKEMPIVFINGLLIFVQGVIVLGLLVNP